MTQRRYDALLYPVVTADTLATHALGMSREVPTDVVIVDLGAELQLFSEFELENVQRMNASTPLGEIVGTRLRVMPEFRHQTFFHVKLLGDDQANLILEIDDPGRSLPSGHDQTIALVGNDSNSHELRFFGVFDNTTIWRAQAELWICPVPGCPDSESSKRNCQLHNKPLVRRR